MSKATGAQTTIAADQPRGAIFGGVAVDGSGAIFLTNLPNHSPPEIVRFDPATGAHTVVSKGDLLVSPFGIAVEAGGALVVADQVNGVLRVDPATGSQSTVSSAGAFEFPFALAVAP